MPIIKSAKKKQRQDKKRQARNAGYIAKYKKATRASAKKSVAESYKAIDKAAKKGVIHKNKAARLKSRVAKLSSKKTA